MLSLKLLVNEGFRLKQLAEKQNAPVLDTRAFYGKARAYRLPPPIIPISSAKVIS